MESTEDHDGNGDGYMIGTGNQNEMIVWIWS